MTETSPRPAKRRKVLFNEFNSKVTYLHHDAHDQVECYPWSNRQRHDVRGTKTKSHRKRSHLPHKRQNLPVNSSEIVPDVIGTTVVVTVAAGPTSIIPVTQTITALPSAINSILQPPSLTSNLPIISRLSLANSNNSFVTFSSSIPNIATRNTQLGSNSVPTSRFTSSTSARSRSQITTTITSKITRSEPQGSVTVPSITRSTTINGSLIIFSYTRAAPAVTTTIASRRSTTRIAVSQPASTTKKPRVGTPSSTTSIRTTPQPISSLTLVSSVTSSPYTLSTYGVAASPSTPSGSSSPTTPAATTSASTGGGSSNLPPILGGVLGGLAGLGLVLWAMLFLLRRHQKRSNNRGVVGDPETERNVSQTRAMFPIASSTPAEPSQPMQQTRSSMIPFAANTFFTRASSSTPPSSERGFVKVSGRKIPSMLGGEMLPKTPVGFTPSGRDISGSTASGPQSVYMEDEAMIHSHTPIPIPIPSRQHRTHMPGMQSTFVEGEPETVGSPPMHGPSSLGESSLRYPTPPPQAPAIRRMQSGADGVGRSLPSQDGSKTSRFKEDV